jgi:protein O-GlcNAc transferase
MTEMMRASVDLWRSVADLDDEALADLIRSDEIDILVDLAGVTSGGRLLAMARRPAPVQITAWGYATGLGLSYIDYLLSDRVAIPPEHMDRHREQILYLPALMAADLEATGDPTPDITPRPDRPPTFGYFGRAMKLTDTMLSVWAQILQSVPNSRLIFKCSDCKDAQRKDRILDLFIGLGVDGHRIEFRGETSRVEHLQQHNDLDVCLDTSPVGGGTTTLDACLMGVPTVTLLGDAVPGRVSASILTAIDEPRLIATSVDAYIAQAVGTALVPGIHRDREWRRRAFLDSIMCDPDRYTRAVEDCFRQAWRAWATTQRRVEVAV